MLKRIKQGGLKSAKALRLLDLMSNSRWRQERLLILGYHGVSLKDEHLWNSELFMSPELLRRRFEIINENGCTVLPLGEAVQRLYKGTLPRKTVVLTFDDGLHDFYKKAVPMLCEFKFAATVYVSTFYVEYNRPVFGVAADYLLWKGQINELNCKSLFGRGEVIDLSVESERRRAHALIVEHAESRKFSAAEKDKLLGDLCRELSIDFATFSDERILRLMTTDEMAEVSRAGIDVQLHTHRHRVPSDPALFRREIDDNRRVILNSTQKRTAHFCYPSGEYDLNLLPCLEKLDVLSATTCEVALSTRKTNPLLLPRLLDTTSLSEIEFEGWLAGTSSFLPQRKSLRR